MFIGNHNLIQFTCLEDDRLVVALKKIDQNEHGFLIIVNSAFKVHGILTDGDVRRYLIKHSELNVSNINAGDICNTQYFYSTIGNSAIARNERIKFLPIVNEKHELIGIDLGKTNGFFIENKYISSGTYPFIIAEIGNNHNGCLDTARKLIDCAAESGAACVKFQHRNMNNLYANQGNNDVSADLSTQYTKDLLNKYNLSIEQLTNLFDYSKTCGLIPMCTAWDITSAQELIEYGLPAYKLASADLTNMQLIDEIVSGGSPLIVSTGMSTEKEIIAAHGHLITKNAKFAMLHCNSTYPAPFDQVNLAYIRKMQRLFKCPIGYSGHERDINVSLAAVALGASIIERHITLDRNMEGADHRASLLPHELGKLVDGIDQVYKALGDERAERTVSQGELINRQNLGKSLVSKRELHVGEIVEINDIEIRSPGSGLHPKHIDRLVGKSVKRDMRKGDLFLNKDIFESNDLLLSNDTKNPIGIPVRYHDHDKLTKNNEFDFVEFHFSYSDLKYDPLNMFTPEQGKFFTSHAPELFEDDHLLDLASDDESYRQKSVDYLKLTIDRTLDVSALYTADEKPILVVNCGGFTQDKFLNYSEKLKKYDVLAKSISETDISEVIFCAQTMPPYPWHFGGQQFHNLFVLPDEINEFCTRCDINVCLDTSHTLMASNFHNFNFFEGLKKFYRLIKHIHLADAKGVDQEGVALGEGELRIEDIKLFFEEQLQDIPIVCETWQGHLNDGANFIRDINKYIATHTRKLN